MEGKLLFGTWALTAQSLWRSIRQGKVLNIEFLWVLVNPLSNLIELNLIVTTQICRNITLFLHKWTGYPLNHHLMAARNSRYVCSLPDLSLPTPYTLPTVVPYHHFYSTLVIYYQFGAYGKMTSDRKISYKMNGSCGSNDSECGHQDTIVFKGG